MIRAFIRSLVIGEAAVGITLITLLSLGRLNALFVANTLTLGGALVLVIRSMPSSGGRVIRISSEGSVHAGERLMQSEIMTASRRLRDPRPSRQQGLEGWPWAWFLQPACSERQCSSTLRSDPKRYRR